MPAPRQRLSSPVKRGRPTAEGGRILVVDDVEDNRDLLARRLRRRGFDVLMCADGYSALDTLERESVDLILLDIMMPGLSGVDVLDVIRCQKGPDELPIIMVTALDEASQMVTALDRGANDYITKPIDYEVLMARVRAQLAVKQLAELKDQFLRMASHDLKNPLQAVFGSARMLEATLPVGAPLTEDGADLLANIGLAAKHMQSIIDDFLGTGRCSGTGPRLETTDVGSIIERMALLQAEYARSKGISVELEVDENLPTITAVESRIVQLIQNLLGNSIKFSPTGARCTVRATGDATGLVIEISDEGPGFTDEELTRVFTPFAQLSNKPTGDETSSGLGLVIAKRVVDLHSGSITVHNNPERGCTFTITLPAEAA